MNNRDKKNIKQQIQSVSKNSRYTEKELSLISNTFLDNNELLMALRKFFLQGELNTQEQILIRELNQDTIFIIRKNLLPEIDPNAPFHQVVDLWVSIDTLNKLVEDVYFDMKARKIVIDYLEQQFERIKRGKDVGDIELKKLVFDGKKDNITAFVELKARNTILTHIDRHLEELRILAIANAKMEPDEKVKLLDSNK